MIALCNSFSFTELFGTDTTIIPEGYIKTYTSDVLGMDNLFQIYRKKDVAVINLRGSTAKKISWMENIYSAMIPAKGTIKIQEDKFKYTFAKDNHAAVHAGYALAMAFLEKDLLVNIKNLNEEGIFNFLITGHSQGGALANMLLAYINNLPENKLSSKNSFKCYAFAAPMIGNKAFTDEYNERFCKTNISFNFVNPADLVPLLPMSYKESSSFSQGVMSLLFDDASLAEKFKDGAFLLFDKNLANTVRRLSTSVAKQISNEVGTVTMPPFVEDINYYKLGNRIEIFKAVYPKILKDSTILQNDSLMAIYPRASNGHFVNKELYKKEPMVYQHKTYNYYTSFLLKFLPEEYELLDRKYLKENL
ncbi:lipase class 3 [Sporocytophaga myxococcoides]|uniref:Lipase class 3 n=2 Tax=Sporocytophaga myxococcoides TaxID=153721 RepID=A0A098LGV2_9BACT|nr:lipase class 3 [Sporocytophaga myxococcoides]